MVRTIYERVKCIMFEARAHELSYWQVVKLLVREGYDQEEVEQAISSLYYPVGLFYERSIGKIALVN